MVMICFVGISCLMLAINNVITSMMPLELRNNINPGLMAGLVNAFCYVGSTLSAVILGDIADQESWALVFDVLFWVTLFSIAFILVSRIFERRNVRS
jgi:sugar phosphate permease